MSKAETLRVYANSDEPLQWSDARSGYEMYGGNVMVPLDTPIGRALLLSVDRGVNGDIQVWRDVDRRPVPPYVLITRRAFNEASAILWNLRMVLNPGLLAPGAD